MVHIGRSHIANPDLASKLLERFEFAGHTARSMN